MSRLDVLITKVEEITSAKDSVIALLRGISQQLRDTAGDQAKIDELANKLDADAHELAQAVVENTPAESPTPTP